VRNIFRLFLFLLTAVMISAGCKKPDSPEKDFHQQRLAEGFHLVKVSVPPDKKYNHIALIAVHEDGRVEPCAALHSKQVAMFGDLLLYLKSHPVGFELYMSDSCRISNGNKPYKYIKNYASAKGEVEFGGFVMKATTSGDKKINPDFKKLFPGEIGFIVHPFLSESNPPHYIEMLKVDLPHLFDRKKALQK